MKRLALGLSTLTVLACPRPSPTDEPDRAATATAGADTGADAGADAEADGAVEPGPVDGERPQPSWLPTADGSPCEHLCAGVFDCRIVESSTHAAASSVELGCLDACTRTAGAEPTGAFASCELVDAPGESSCSPFMACVRAAWPGATQPGPEPGVDPVMRDGCQVGCERFAECEGAPPEAARMCTEGCRDALNAEQEAAFGECSKFDDCVQVEMCIMNIPGA